MSRKEVEKRFVHFCYVCDKFVIGRWQTHKTRAHVAQLTKMMCWAAVGQLDDQALQVVMNVKAAAEPQTESDASSDEEVGGVAVGARGKRSLAAASVDGAAASGDRKRAAGGTHTRLD